VEFHDAALFVDIEVGHNNLEVHQRTTRGAAHIFPSAGHFVFPVNPFPGLRALEVVEQHFVSRHAFAFLANLLVEEFEVLIFVDNAAECPS
jgi:hypothetical protein